MLGSAVVSDHAIDVLISISESSRAADRDAVLSIVERELGVSFGRIQGWAAAFGTAGALACAIGLVVSWAWGGIADNYDAPWWHAPAGLVALAAFFGYAHSSFVLMVKNERALKLALVSNDRRMAEALGEGTIRLISPTWLCAQEQYPIRRLQDMPEEAYVPLPLPRRRSSNVATAASPS
jgi:hypothetical protein